MSAEDVRYWTVMIPPRRALALCVVLTAVLMGAWKMLPVREAAHGVAPLCLREGGESGTRPWENQPCCEGLRPLKKSVRSANGWYCDVPEKDEDTYVCARCGDGICGRAENSCNCKKDCPIPWTCGNGKVQKNEQCDDRNRRTGDGCSERCTVEEGWWCAGAPSKCTARRTSAIKRTATGSDLTSCLGREDGTAIRLNGGCTVCTCYSGKIKTCTGMPCR